MHALDKVDELLAELKQLPPISQKDQQELEKKFRLEFNYNSNHIEGNTLTYSETELLLIFDDTKGNHTMREYEEMKAHDIAYRMVEEWAKDKERPLTEQNIKNLNEIILVRPFWKEAITPDGQATRRQIKIGNYKEHPNSVRLASGELFEYTSPQDTPIEMDDLINWYRSEERAIHPVTLAAMLHYKFVGIHPFDDGNGRVARLIMNCVLLRNDLPPVIIRSADKGNYLRALHLADVGDYGPFIEYVAEQLIWSLQKSIDATKGKSIEDADDLDKEIELLKRRNSGTTQVKVKKSREAIQKAYKESLEKLFITIEKNLTKFDGFFLESSHNFSVENAVVTTKLKGNGNSLDIIKDQLFFDANDSQRYGKFTTGIGYVDGHPTRPVELPDINQIRASYNWKAYESAGVDAFNIHQSIEVIFEDTKYTVKDWGKNAIMIQKLYDQVISDVEAENFAKALAKEVLGQIKLNIERIDKEKQ